MPTNQTENYQLSQWMKSDKVQMEDFNADNAKIDAALKAEADARAALAGQLSQKGNCGICFASYVGHGQYGDASPNTLTFPHIPSLIFLIGKQEIGVLAQGLTRLIVVHDSTNTGGQVVWSEDKKTVTWRSGTLQNQLSEKGVTYQAIVFYTT